MILEIIWLVFASFHTIPFGAYILYMKHIAEKKSWNINIEPHFEPSISIIIPTYNEARTIRRKLDNLHEVDYPKNKIEIIIVDSASTDGTSEIAEEWAEKHPETKIRILKEDKREGMVRALNTGLEYVEGEIVIKTDSDCLWFKDSLRNAVKYLADPQVGSVASLHKITAHRETGAVKAEKKYREFYKWLRIGESKLHSTVLYEGELMLVKRKVLDELKGFDVEIGGDDVPTALRVAEKGYRAITAEDAYFLELTPYTWKERFNQKVRRARHVLQALWKYKRLNFGGKTLFHRLILPMETYIYMINPLLAVPLALTSAMIIIRYPWLLLFLILLLFGEIRELGATHLSNIIIMLTAIVKETVGKEPITWEKIEEIR